MKPSELYNERILISPLNWGMGHVSRCIGLIHELLKNNNHVFIAADEQQQSIFRCYFPELTYIDHRGYPFQFNGKGNFGMDLVLASRKLFRRWREEKKETEQYVAMHRITVVVADHRYGFFSSKVRSIFLTHQLDLPVKWYERPVQWMHHRLVKRFDEIWVLDDPNSRLAGKLSLNTDQFDATYIGPYSRFQIEEEPMAVTAKTVLLVSGPLIYGQNLIDEAKDRLVSGDVVIASEHLKVPSEFIHLYGDWKMQDAYLRNAKKIISRSGYSTIMDHAFLKAEIEYIPTPGQREQEYLNTLHGKRSV